jgi:abnormal spindle-like microcephaly-associated protein
MILSKASSQIQQAFRSYLARAAFSKLRRGIAMFQSSFRGRNVRAVRSQKIRSQAARIVRANANAKADPKMQLGARTKSALDVLRKSRSLIEIMNAICLLEFATRYSKACCIAFAQAGAPDILFPLIRSCNRSIPHIQIVGAVLLTLANVAKYESLLPSMASVVGADVILDLVQMFRDKEDIFPLASSLLESFVSNSEEVKVSLRGLSSTIVVEALLQILALSFRRLDVHLKKLESA